MRAVSTSGACGADVTVVVPSMGDSITEGAVASVDKKPGALVWMWLHSRKLAVAPQQFSKVTNVFGQRVAVRYYR